MEDLLDKIEVILKDEKIEKEVKQIEGRIKRTKTKRNKLADGYLDGIIPRRAIEKLFSSIAFFLTLGITIRQI